jgi:hypothetical protein
MRGGERNTLLPFLWCTHQWQDTEWWYISTVETEGLEEVKKQRAINHNHSHTTSTQREKKREIRMELKKGEN